jgi:opacity protein-like surface antigen
MVSKRWVSIILAVVLLSTSVTPVLAQGAKPFTQFRFGTLNPNDTDAGLMLGVRTGRDFDQQVLVGFSADLFWRKYTRESSVSSDTTIGGVHYSTLQRSVDYTTLILPLMITIDVQIPVQNSPVKPYIGGGIGYELVFNKENNYDEGISDSRFYSGFGYQIEVGALYKMSPSVDFTLEGFYNGCKAKRGAGTDMGLPTWEEVDVSGMGGRIGVVLRGWGI